MVIQRGKPLQLSGQAPPDLAVKIKVTWNKKRMQTTADSTGNWRLEVPVGGADGRPQTIVFEASGFGDISFSNILIGDVWVCSGQSNMVMPLDSVSPFKGVLNFREEIAAAAYPAIRVLDVQEYQNAAMSTGSPFSWKVCSPATAGNISAVAYYFARKIHKDLNIPVGIIVAAVNGSCCQYWANVETIKSDPVLAAEYLSGSSSLYEGMIRFLTNLSISGFIWYQGESNKNDAPDNYARLNAALINGWRAKFNKDQLPFYYVQLAPFTEEYANILASGTQTAPVVYAKFREAQAKIRSVPGTGMAVAMDVGELDNHHPRNKKPVGERLALLALKETYRKNVQCYGPQFASFAVLDSVITVHYLEGTAQKLNTLDHQSLAQVFYIAGTDHVFRLAKATIHGNTVQVIAPAGTPFPILAVRYAFTDVAVTNLQNGAGLPAEPFRTDNWNN